MGKVMDIDGFLLSQRYVGYFGIAECGYVHGMCSHFAWTCEQISVFVEDNTACVTVVLKGGRSVGYSGGTWCHNINSKQANRFSFIVLSFF